MLGQVAIAIHVVLAHDPDGVLVPRRQIYHLAYMAVGAGVQCAADIILASEISDQFDIFDRLLSAISVFGTR